MERFSERLKNRSITVAARWSAGGVKALVFAAALR
jgi:hypothetical protein